MGPTVPFPGALVQDHDHFNTDHEHLLFTTHSNILSKVLYFRLSVRWVATSRVRVP